MSDPLNGAPDNARWLFHELSNKCAGFSADDVMLAALNLMINTVRQNRAKRSEAAELWDERVAKGRHILLQEHYDARGNRRQVYPFHQVISAETVRNLNKLRGF